MLIGINLMKQISIEWTRDSDIISVARRAFHPNLSTGKRHKTLQAVRSTRVLPPKILLNPNLGIKDILLHPGEKSRASCTKSPNSGLQSQNIDIVEACKLQQYELLYNENLKKQMSNIISPMSSLKSSLHNSKSTSSPPNQSRRYLRFERSGKAICKREVQ